MKWKKFQFDAVIAKHDALLSLISETMSDKDPGSATSCLNAVNAAASTNLPLTTTAGAAYVNISTNYLDALSSSTSTAYSATSVTTTQVKSSFCTCVAWYNASACWFCFSDEPATGR